MQAMPGRLAFRSLPALMALLAILALGLSAPPHTSVIAKDRVSVIQWVPMIQASNVLDQLLEPVGRSITPGLARELVDLRASPDVQARIDDLADKCNEGTLSPDERAEYERYVGAIHLIGILQRKARKVLSSNGTSA